jgi:hypothetical protein
MVVVSDWGLILLLLFSFLTWSFPLAVTKDRDADVIYSEASEALPDRSSTLLVAPYFVSRS